MRRWVFAAIFIAATAWGWCHDPSYPGPETVPEPIDGTANYRAMAAGQNFFVVTLPHGTDSTKISRIEVWVNTAGVEAHRVNNRVTYDEIHLVSDNSPHPLIVRAEIFKSVLSGPG